ncbi:MAG: P1 family peptidase [Acidobacteriota bacterium]|nr:P1 family peptidase [Acidobacteriota bacterium]
MPKTAAGRTRLPCLAVAALYAMAVTWPSPLVAQARPRARALGIPFSGTPGPLNAITDISGVEVGHTTIIEGNGPLVVGKGPVRTGVTAIFPTGKTWKPVFAGWFAGNGFGEMTGAPWVVEGGVLGGPVMITGTYSVGVVRDAVNSWFHEVLKREIPWHQPVVGETSDAFLNDGLGQHVTKAHVFQALNTARTGPVPEGNVGGGTGMVAHGFKGGIGTASRRLAGPFTIGVLVQANYGTREALTIAGVPIGRDIVGAERTRGAHPPEDRDGSIIVVVATDAPLLPHQLERVARRVPMGIARLGSVASNGSGDIFIAFSTANPGAAAETGVTPIAWLPNGDLTPIFEATVEATEEAIVNALVAAETMVGINGNAVPALPTDQVRAILKRYGRLVR